MITSSLTRWQLLQLKIPVPGGAASRTVPVNCGLITAMWSRCNGSIGEGVTECKENHSLHNPIAPRGWSVILVVVHPTVYTDTLVTLEKVPLLPLTFTEKHEQIFIKQLYRDASTQCSDSRTLDCHTRYPLAPGSWECMCGQSPLPRSTIFEHNSAQPMSKPTISCLQVMNTPLSHNAPQINITEYYWTMSNIDYNQSYITCTDTYRLNCKTKALSTPRCSPSYTKLLS